MPNRPGQLGDIVQGEPVSTEQRIAVLMTCFNRREATLACLHALYEQLLPEGLELNVYLVDDGSADGTETAVRSRFPAVRVLPGTGTLYWAGGMRKAWNEALKGGYPYYLWLNDDTSLYPDAVACMLETYASIGDGRAIIVGTTQDPRTGATTYGGVVRTDRRRALRFDVVEPSAQLQRCETMNGNCVLVPADAVSQLGIISEEFTHGMADYDYGLRANARGVPVVVAPAYVGTCERDHPEAGSWRDRELSRRERWKRITSRKGLPPKEWLRFSRRHGGPMWPLLWMSPYLRVLVGR